MNLEPQATRSGLFRLETTLASDTCHLRLNDGERGKFERAARHLGISMSAFAREAWEWWLDQQ